jgi:hypothetical protein
MEKLAAFNTMTAIKKKMHNMKQDKENAFDKADQLEQKLIEHRAVSEKVCSVSAHIIKSLYSAWGFCRAVDYECTTVDTCDDKYETHR